MADVTIYHNPRCSRSRETLALLEARGLEVEVVLYLENPPSKTALGDLIRAMGKKPFDLIRVKDPLFKELGLSRGDRRSTSEWLKIMVEHPGLIERPIVRAGNKVALGRPPENVLEILG